MFSHLLESMTSARVMVTWEDKRHNHAHPHFPLTFYCWAQCPMAEDSSLVSSGLLSCPDPCLAQDSLAKVTNLRQIIHSYLTEKVGARDFPADPQTCLLHLQMSFAWQCRHWTTRLASVCHQSIKIKPFKWEQNTLALTVCSVTRGKSVMPSLCNTPEPIF